MRAAPMTPNQLRLVEAIAGWQDPHTKAKQERARQLERAREIWAAYHPEPLTFDETLAELLHLWGSHTPRGVCERVGYPVPASLLRRLRRNGYGDRANRLEAALRNNTWPASERWPAQSSALVRILTRR